MSLSGCGDSKTGTLFVLFDASKSSSELIREGYREGALLAGLKFCQRYTGSGEILFNVITGTPEADSSFRSVPCPERKNETQFRGQLLVFRAQLAGVIEEMIRIQAERRGSDILAATLYAASHSFARFASDDKFLFLFSDMQQSGVVRDCLLRGKSRPRQCLQRYFRQKPDFAKSEHALRDVAVFVAGVGLTVKGQLPDRERRAYKTFWRAFFQSQEALVCWFESGNLPIIVQSDGTREVNEKYFDSTCPPVL